MRPDAKVHAAITKCDVPRGQPVVCLRSTTLGGLGTAAFAEDAELLVVSAGATVRGRPAVAHAIHHFFHVSFSQTTEQIRTALQNEKHAACDWLFGGTHTGWLDGIAPTGKRVVLPFTAFYDLDDDGIRSVRFYYDTATLMRQLGYA